MLLDNLLIDVQDFYRNARRREMIRMEVIENDAKEAAERETLIEKIEKNRIEAEARTKKNAEKRHKKKEKRKLKKISQTSSNGGEVEDNDSTDDEVSEENKQEEKRVRTEVAASS